MTSDSACVTRLQLCPEWSSAVDITAKPRPSAVLGLVLAAGTPSTPTASLVVDGAVPDSCSIPQLTPWVISNLWFHCGCGAQGLHGLAGS
jgi:hypothetical protein